MPRFFLPVRPLLSIVAAFAVAVGAAACLGGSSSTTPGTSKSPSTSAGHTGGTLVVGAEQEPDCADWISVCAGAIWGNYTMAVTTLPTAFDTRKVDGTWKLVPSNVLAGEPTVEQHGGEQVITYKINPKAVWSDGTPITSDDFKYTALQIRDGKGIFDKTGYDLIKSVATPDKRTAVVTLESSYGPWRQLFGGSNLILPAHLLSGKDRNKVMRDGYSFSGGPWKIASWKKGTSVTLVPNDRYWGNKPKLDKVVFQFIPDTAAAFQALKSGQVQALYPSPQLEAVAQIKTGIPNTNVQVEPHTGNLEALWMNHAAFPFDDPAVRKALAHAIDRKAIVQRLYGALDVTEPAQSFVTPLVGGFGGTDFSQYSLDLGKVDATMKGAGWAKDGDGIWTKDGNPAEFTIVSLAGDKRRELIEQILQKQLADAGFSMTIKNTTPAELFSKQGPRGDFQLGLWTLIDTVPEPTQSASFASTSIPSAKTGYAGLNLMRIDVPGLDELLHTVDTSTDEAARREASLQADKLMAENVASLPLAVLPVVLMTSTSVGGPISNNPAEGPWWNLEDWTRG
jgi:peptide/nickel transport system substrate-binding protein